MEKYTAKQWAEIEGGHTMSEPKKSQYSFISDLNESRQYRTRQQIQRSNAREIVDHAFLDMITLWILYNEFDMAPIAVKYANKTMMYGGFRSYRQSGTDLYVALHLIQARDADTMAGDSTDDALLQRIKFPEQIIKTFLNTMKQNATTAPQARQSLQLIERKFFITNSNYRSIRRLAQDWPRINATQRALVVTRLLQFYRTHARRSELFGFLQDYARTKKLEIRNAHNAEKPKSKSMNTIAQAAALGAAGYAGFQVGRSIGKGLV
jgi:hypothetical protein|tara:strand:+ start:212 stop:1006 length:795 start_codon:yes stop_codon:yes gene_type:complete